MAELSAGEKVAIRKKLCRRALSVTLEGFTSLGLSNLTKPDIDAAVDATDTWIDSNQVSYVAALPANWKNNSTPFQKVLLFAMVAFGRVK